MIVNRPESSGYEGKLHLKAKVRVAKLGDKYLEELKEVHNKKWKVTTVYEYKFPTLLTELGPKTYRADVFFDVSYMEDVILRHHTMTVEVDGTIGHAGDWEGMKDKIRDQRLVEMICCPVIRLSTYEVMGTIRKKPSLRKDLSPMTDIEILNALDLVKNMKLPIQSLP